MTNVTQHKEKSFFNQIMPFDCLLLWVALTVTIPLTIKTISGIGTPIINWLEGFVSSFNPELLVSDFALPKIPVTVIMFSCIGIVVCLTLFVLIQARYINNWYIAADRKNIYQTVNKIDSLMSLASWIIFRFFFILYPVIIMSIITSVLAFLSIKFFNILAILMGANLELVMISGIFLTLTTGFLWVCAIALTSWNLITSVYGSIIAVVEPNVSNILIRRRSRRFAFLTSNVWGAYLVYLFVMGVLFLEFVYLLLIPSSIAFKNILAIVLIQVVNIVIFIFLGRSLTFSYYKSLLIQYAKISVKKSNKPDGKNESLSGSPSKYSVSMM